MIRTVSEIDSRALERFDAVIDVRSPAEFAEDHLPGAINLPVLDDAERAEVGRIYVQESKFRARRLGAAYVARNIARRLETALADRPASFAPLVHCWRGGQRSHAMATILDQVGWPVAVLAGGYRTWRRHVTGRLYEGELPHRLVLLDGGTGTAKTELLGRLAAQGAQTLDLEALAAHRGSLLGGWRDRPQPPQKLFESRLMAALERLDPGRPVIVEAESSKIGERMIPPALWRAMAAAPRVRLEAPAEARARYLARAYDDLAADPEALQAALLKLPSRPGRRRVADWLELARGGEHEALAAALIEHHYDPAYARSAGAEARTWLGVVQLADLTPDRLEAAAGEVSRLAATAGDQK